jgi:serine protease Do
MTYLVPLALALLAQADAKPADSPADLVAALESAVADAIARAEPSVVAITRERSDNGEETVAVRGRRQPPQVEQPPQALFPGGMRGLNLDDDDFIAMPGDFGSGVVIGDRGEILTCYHIVKGAVRIKVRAPGRQKFDAEVLAADPRSDLAVIAPRVAPGAAGPKLKPIPIGDATRLRKGSFLLVLGNPYNAARDGRASAGWGILANTARRIEATPEERRQTMIFRHQPSLLQLDAKLNLGLSGGAVVTLKGELVGISTTGGNPAGFDAQAGYAIPMDALGRRIVEAMKQGKEAEYGFLGVTLGRDNRIGGVQAGSPAVEAGLLAEDAILAVDGRPVGEDGLSLALSTVAPGQTVKLKVRHANGKVEDKSVTMAKYPTRGPVIVTSRPDPWRGVRVDFTSVLSGGFLDVETARRYEHGGVGVVEVESGSPADQAGLKKGLVITEVDGRAVRNPADFAAAVADKKGPVTLTTELGDEPEKKITIK